MYGERGWFGSCGGGETEEARIGEEERGDEKVGRCWCSWLLPWSGRPKENVGGVWGIIAYIAVVPLDWWW